VNQPPNDESLMLFEAESFENQVKNNNIDFNNSSLILLAEELNLSGICDDVQ